MANVDISDTFVCSCTLLPTEMFGSDAALLCCHTSATPTMSQGKSSTIGMLCHVGGGMEEDA